MSACPQTSQPLPAGTGWIDLPTAAARSGRTIGHLARECRGKYAAQNLAKLEAPPEGGKPIWMIHETADAAFARVQSREQLNENFDRRLLSENQRRRLKVKEYVAQQWAIVRAVAIAAGKNVQAQLPAFIERMALEKIQVSQRSIYSWHGAYVRDGLVGLVEEPWLKKIARAAMGEGEGAGEGDRHAQFYEQLNRWWLAPQKRSKQLSFDKARDEAELRGWPIPTYRSACRVLDAIDPAIVALHRGGESAHAAAAGCNRRDYSDLAANEMWCGDHHRFDVRVDDGTKEGARPWLTAWLDMRSRLFVGWRIFLHDPNQDTILDAFHDGGEKHGYPHHVLIDNGKDFDAVALQGITKRQRLSRKKRTGPSNPLMDLGVFGELGVEVHHAQPYRPQSKPIERAFRTVCERFSKLWDTYCGNSPENRPDNLGEQLKAGKAPSLAEFTQAFSDWLESDYHARPHTGDAMNGQSPAQAHAAHLKEKRIIPEGKWELARMKPTKELKVTANGITWKHLVYGRDQRTQSLIPELRKLQGQMVFCRINEHMVDHIHVYSLDGRFLCVAPSNLKLPARAKDRQVVREVVKKQKRDQRTREQYFEARPRLHQTIPQRLRAAAAAASPAPASDASLSIVRTPLDDQLPAIQKAMERRTLKIAAGAESMSEDPRDTRAALDRVFCSPSVDADGEAGGGDTFMKLQTAMNREDCDE